VDGPVVEGDLVNGSALVRVPVADGLVDRAVEASQIDGGASQLHGLMPYADEDMLGASQADGGASQLLASEPQQRERPSLRPPGCSLQSQYRKGIITDDERRQELTEIWTQATDEVRDAMEARVTPTNPIFTMAHSGA
jgi:hypothetical protein